MEKELFKERLQKLLRLDGYKNWSASFYEKMVDEYSDDFEEKIKDVKDIIDYDYDFDDFYSTYNFSFWVNVVGQNGVKYSLDAKNFEIEKFYFSSGRYEIEKIISILLADGKEIDFIYLNKEDGGYIIVFENRKEVELKEAIETVKNKILFKIKKSDCKNITLYENWLEEILDFEDFIYKQIKYSLTF